jgi:hypothetical protein
MNLFEEKRKVFFQEKPFSPSTKRKTPHAITTASPERGLISGEVVLSKRANPPLLNERND